MSPGLGTGDSVKERVRTEKKEPQLFKVLLLNDDYTTMEFVTEVLMNVFRKSRLESTRIMLSVHRSGKGIAGIYPREIAEAKSGQAMDLARSRAYPLLVTTEPE